MLSRRNLVRLLGSGAACILAGRSHAEQPVRFRWRVPAAHQQTVKDSLRYDGTETAEKDTRGVPLLVIFAGIAMLPSLADAILTLRRKLVQPGMTIDARGEKIDIEVDSRLPKGTMLIVDASGAKLFQPEQLTSPAELVKALTGGKGG